jgi:hypothetical protein
MSQGNQPSRTIAQAVKVFLGGSIQKVDVDMWPDGAAGDGCSPTKTLPGHTLPPVATTAGTAKPRSVSALSHPAAAAPQSLQSSGATQGTKSPHAAPIDLADSAALRAEFQRRVDQGKAGRFAAQLGVDSSQESTPHGARVRSQHESLDHKAQSQFNPEGLIVKTCLFPFKATWWCAKTIAKVTWWCVTTTAKTLGSMVMGVADSANKRPGAYSDSFRKFGGG